MTDKNIVTKYVGFGKYLDNPVRRIDIRFIHMIVIILLLFISLVKVNSIKKRDK